jgi:hypothetical protein
MHALRFVPRLETMEDRLQPDGSLPTYFQPPIVVVEPIPTSISSGMMDPGIDPSYSNTPADGDPIKAPGFKTIDELKDKLSKDKAAKDLLDAFIKDGGVIESNDKTFSGGGFVPKDDKAKTPPKIFINPNKTGKDNDASSVLLFELLRYKYMAKGLEIDQEAIDGKLTKDEYAKKKEQMTYDLIKEHVDIARAGIKAGNFDESRFLKSGEVHPTRASSGTRWGEVGLLPLIHSEC